MTIEIETYQCFFIKTQSRRAPRGIRFESPYNRDFVSFTKKLVVLSPDEILRITVPTNLRNIQSGRETKRERLFKEGINKARLFIPGKRPGERMRLHWKP